MKNRLVSVLAAVFVSAIPVHSEEICSLKEFDKAEPKHVSDMAPVGADVNFEWGSDADPRPSDRWKSWHYVKNLNKRELSLHWEKPGLLIAFGKPLPMNGIFCSFAYADEGGFYVQEAPIKVSSGETVAAEAYVPKPQKIASRGAEIKTEYSLPDGTLKTANALIYITYTAETAQIEFATGNGIHIGINPTDFGLGFDNFIASAAEQKVSIGEAFDLKEVDATGDELFETFLSRSKGSFFSISSPGTKMVVQRSNAIAAETPILVLTDSRELIAATKLVLNGSQ